MSTNADPTQQQSSSVGKRKIQPVSYCKKLRSKIPRRKRFPLLPTFSNFSSSLSVENMSRFSIFPAASCSSSCLSSEVSYSSSLIPSRSEKLKNGSKSSRQKIDNVTIGSSGTEFQAETQCFRETGKVIGVYSRPITRLYYKKIENERMTEKKDNGGQGEIELSESSCVESFTEENARNTSKSELFPGRNRKRKFRSIERAEKVEEREGIAASAAALSEISCIKPFSQEIGRNFFISSEVSCKGEKLLPDIQGTEPSGENSFLESPVNELSQNATEVKVKGVLRSGFSDDSRNLSDCNLKLTTEQKPVDSDLYSHLLCSEEISDEEEDSEFSSHELTLSEIEAEIFCNISDEDFSDNSLSLPPESADEFSQRSAGDSVPSACFSLFLQYAQQFSKSSPPGAETEYTNEFTLLKFEDEEHEESYKNFRSRERKQIFLHDYAEEYLSTTHYGDLIVQQRLLMVHWIVEHTNNRELHWETLFLGVGLLDRFLSRGFFKIKRNLQVLGIACVTLATRIEENQPLNLIQQKTFQVGRNVYNRHEVVAMEWLVQEVLNFQCFLPTTYNFLWFYLKAAKANAEVVNRAKYLAVLSLLDHERLCFWPSTVAAGLVILASLATNNDFSCQHVMEAHIRTKNDDLPECIQSLEWLVQYAC